MSLACRQIGPTCLLIVVDSNGQYNLKKKKMSVSNYLVWDLENFLSTLISEVGIAPEISRALPILNKTGSDMRKVQYVCEY